VLEFTPVDVTGPWWLWPRIKNTKQKNKYLRPIDTKVLKHYWQNYKTNNNGTI